MPAGRGRPTLGGRALWKVQQLWAARELLRPPVVVGRRNRGPLVALVTLAWAASMLAAAPAGAARRTLKQWAHVVKRLPATFRGLADRKGRAMMLAAARAKWQPDQVGYKKVLLGDIHALHPIDNWESTKRQVDARVQALLPHRDRVLGAGLKIDHALLEQMLPSGRNIELAFDPKVGTYVTLEGVGRVEALRRAFGPNLEVEVMVSNPTPSQLEQLWGARRAFELPAPLGRLNRSVTLTTSYDVTLGHRRLLEPTRLTLWAAQAAFGSK
jgi:hypothetical protein